MKFGKEFQQILDDSDFPDEWKSSAIEYRRLKKIIKDVVSELSDMGLSPDVLHRLLAAEEDESGASTPSEQAGTGAPHPHQKPVSIGQGEMRHASADGHLSVISGAGADDEVLEFEFESDEASPPTFGSSSVTALASGSRVNGSSRQPYPHADPILDDGGVVEAGDEPDLSRSHESGASGSRSLSNSYSYASASGSGSALHPRNFRVRLLSDSRPAHGQQSGLNGVGLDTTIPAHGRATTAPMPIRPMSVADAMRSVDGDVEGLAGSLESVSASLGRQRTHSGDDTRSHRRVVRRSMHEGGVRAKYVFAGDTNHPEPQLRFHLAAPLSTSPTASASGWGSASAGPSTSSRTPSQSRSRSRSRSASPSPSASAGSEVLTDDDPDNDDDEDDDLVCLPIPQPTPRAYPFPLSAATSPTTIKAGHKSPFLVPSIDVSSPSIPPSPTLQRLHMARSPIYALAAGSPGMVGALGSGDDVGLHALSLGESAVDLSSDLEDPDGRVGWDGLDDSPSHDAPQPPGADSAGETSAQPNHPARDRDIIIPLASDRAFFDLLTAALTSLSAFHLSQQEAFRTSVENLCRSISASIVPSGASVQVMSIPPMPPSARGVVPASASGPGPSTSLIPSHAPTAPYRPPPDILARRITKMHKKDLYAWREIFTLWIEAEIFESSAERTRGERTVDAAEARLQRFAGEVVRRGLGDRRTFRGKKTRGAWDEFLRLNVLLLDLKRFQLANINAARKILKKHDKRTALTASTGFQSFARATLETVGKDGSVSTWTFYNTSLPHVLLASLTDVLLPILPSLDDYACLICTSIAFKPIRLACQHLFCVRCLVKMQRAGQAECPLCRSSVVLLANKDSLDVQVMEFMRDWFPREVKAKQRENDEEIAEEIRAENGGQGDGCVVM